MFEIALNKCTVLLSTTGLEENIPTIEALIWAQRAVPQQPAPNSSLCSPTLSPVSQHPLLDEGRAATALVDLHSRDAAMLFLSTWLTLNSAVRTLEKQ